MGAFDKELYWERRGKGLRGQPDIKTVGTLSHSPDWPKKPVTKKAMLKNTKRARQAALAQ